MIGSIKVFIADKAPIFASGMAQALSGDERVEVVGEAYSGQDVMDKIQTLNPNVVILDAHLPKNGGIQVLQMLQEQHPKIKVIILAPPDNIEVLLESALSAGAKGFLPNTISPTELVKGVVEMADGGTAIGITMIPLILNKLVKIKRRQEKKEVAVVLSIREREIMELVAGGMCNREIAETLLISENTVKGYVRRIIDKLDVNNRVEVARYVLLNKRTEQGIPNYTAGRK